MEISTICESALGKCILEKQTSRDVAYSKCGQETHRPSLCVSVFANRKVTGGTMSSVAFVLCSAGSLGRRQLSPCTLPKRRRSKLIDPVFEAGGKISRVWKE